MTYSERDEILYPNLELPEEANQLLDTLVESYLAKNIPEDTNSTMEMWRIRELVKMQAEEIVLKQIVLISDAKPLQYTYVKPKKELVVPHEYIVEVLKRGTS